MVLETTKNTIPHMIQALYRNLRSTPKPQQPISFHISDLEAFTRLTNAQQKLLVAMIRSVKTSTMYTSVVNELDYSKLGYNRRQNFYRDKNALEDAGWILTEGTQYVICMHKVKYTSKNFYDNLMEYFGLKAGITMGDKFTPDPNFIPKPPKVSNK